MNIQVQKLDHRSLGPYPKTRQTRQQLPEDQGSLGLSRIPRQDKDEQQTDSPAASGSGFRLTTQAAAVKGLNVIFSLDLNTAIFKDRPTTRTET